MDDLLEIKRFKSHKENASAVYEFLSEAFNDLRLQEDPLLDALSNDVLGLLAGIAHGTINTAQPRIVERLIQIIQNAPLERNMTQVVTAIAVCGECGLTASTQPIPRYPHR